MQTRTKLQQTLKAVFSFKEGLLILSGTKILYSKILCLIFFINISVVSAMSSTMVKVSDT